jgi:hypothetical protein
VASAVERILPPPRRRLYPSWDRAVQPWSMGEYNFFTTTRREEPVPIVAAKPLSIPAGESLSSSVDATDGQLVRLIMPEQWTPRAALTFEISYDGITFHPLFDNLGAEVSINCYPATTVFVPSELRLVAFAKLRSGTREAPVAQDSQRDFMAVVVK